jgi:hypothetical protein
MRTFNQFLEAITVQTSIANYSQDFENNISEIFDQINNLDYVNRWIGNNIIKWAKEHEGSGYAYSLLGHINRLLLIVGLKSNSNIPHVDVQNILKNIGLYYRERNEDPDDEYGGIIKGEFFFKNMPGGTGEEIFKYSSHGDGYDFVVEINWRNLKANIEKFIQMVKNTNNQQSQ